MAEKKRHTNRKGRPQRRGTAAGSNLRRGKPAAGQGLPAEAERRMSGVKTAFPKPGNMLYPLPAVMVTCQDEDGKPNIITVAWTGTVCSDPPMLSISVRKERYSYDIIRRTGEFTVNLTTEELARVTDWCGVRSGRDYDKFKETGLTPVPGVAVGCPSIKESPVSLECKVEQVIELGSHDMFLARVETVLADASLMDEKGRFRLDKTDLICYSHGEYFTLGEKCGSFGFSVRKKR